VRGPSITALLVALVPLSLLDQVSRYCLPQHAGLQAAYSESEDHVRQIEAELPEEAAVFQLPCASFPEQGTVNRMNDYSHFRAYLHSTRLHWSFGTMRGRYGDAWQHSVAERPTADMVEALCLAGFTGIYVDRAGYPDWGQALETRLATVLGRPPILSREGRWAFYNMTYYRDVLKGQLTEAEWSRRRKQDLHALLARWGPTFQDLESDAAGDNVRWGMCQGAVTLHNPRTATVKVRLQARFATAQEARSLLHIQGASFVDDLNVSSQEQAWSRTIEMQPGKARHRFRL